jgi:hypothetical protein
VTAEGTLPERIPAMPTDQEKPETEATTDETKVRVRRYAAQNTALCLLIELLIDKGALDEDEVIARFELLSRQFRTIKGGTEMVELADTIVDYVAGRSDRKPS